MGHEESAAVALGVYKPRRPQASPLFRLVSDHVQRLQTVYDERFAREYGPWRPVVGQVADKFLACGILDRGFARVAARTLTAAPCSGCSCASSSSTRTKPPGCSRGRTRGSTCIRQCGSPRTIGRSRHASRATARAIPWRWND